MNTESHVSEKEESDVKSSEFYMSSGGEGAADEDLLKDVKVKEPVEKKDDTNLDVPSYLLNNKKYKVDSSFQPLAKRPKKKKKRNKKAELLEELGKLSEKENDATDD